MCLLGATIILYNSCATTAAAVSTTDTYYIPLLHTWYFVLWSLLVLCTRYIRSLSRACAHETLSYISVRCSFSGLSSCAQKDLSYISVSLCMYLFSFRALHAPRKTGDTSDLLCIRSLSRRSRAHKVLVMRRYVRIRSLSECLCAHEDPSYVCARTYSAGLSAWDVVCPHFPQHLETKMASSSK